MGGKRRAVPPEVREAVINDLCDGYTRFATAERNNVSVGYVGKVSAEEGLGRKARAEMIQGWDWVWKGDNIGAGKEV